MSVPASQFGSDRHTYRDYCQWPDDVRYELIDGVAYLMSPAPNWRHQEIAGGVYAQLYRQLEGHPCRVAIAPLDVRLPKADEADDEVDTVVQPDVLIVCEAHKIDRRGIRGAPTFVLEVLSPSSARHDHIRKRALYERVGVQEFWLLHPVDGVLTRYRRRADAAGFEQAEFLACEGVIALSCIADLSVDFSGLYPAPEQD